MSKRTLFAVLLSIIAITGLVWRYRVVNLLDVGGWQPLDVRLLLLGASPYLSTMLIAWRWPIVAVPVLAMAAGIEWVFALPAMDGLDKGTAASAVIVSLLNPVLLPFGLFAGAALNLWVADTSPES